MVLKRFCALSIILNIKYNRCKFPPDEAFDTRTGDDAEDVDLPNCDATKSGYDDYVVFKTEMKRYAKASADPGSISMLLWYGDTIRRKKYHPQDPALQLALSSQREAYFNFRDKNENFFQSVCKSRLRQFLREFLACLWTDIFNKGCSFILFP